MSTQKQMTVDEIVASLRHSDLPTIIVEGKEDMPIYRWVETRLGIGNADVLEVGGRKILLSLFERRQEFPELPVAFVADRDMWLFSGIPSDYEGVIWTEGYSIENDLYAGAKLENLLDTEDVHEYRQLLDAIVEWFAFEVEEYLAGRFFEVGNHCRHVVPLGQTQMDEKFLNDRDFRQPEKNTYQQIRNDYVLQLRGKQLFQILERVLNTPNRGTRYNINSLRETALKMTDVHPLMGRLTQKIEQKIEDQISVLMHDSASQ
ncbi:MAG: DUF4435 domain-containing protein [Caldilineaceae bacterium]|nr:DUF4435 domain-containing protein [Caldilineaceae bacterium]